MTLLACLRLLRRASRLCLMGLLAFALAGMAEAQSVQVEYRVVSESHTDQIVTQSIEVHVLNAGPDTMRNASATISVLATVPIDPLGQVVLGDVPTDSMVTQIAELSYSVALHSTVRSAPGLMFALTFLDATGQRSVISTLGTRVP